MDDRTRRSILGATGAFGAAALAGCAETSSEQGPGELDAADFAGVDEWLGSDEVGGVADNYDGTVLDYRNLDPPTITVGAEGNGGSLAFDPPAIVANMEHNVKWEWSGAGSHNVVAEPAEQLEISNVELDTDDPVADRDPFYHGTGGVKKCFYKCESHLDDGMKGVVIWR